MPKENGPGSAHILARLTETLNGAASNLVPWFFENMPEYYFRTHEEDEQLRHLQGILTAQVKTEKQAVVLKSPCGTRITHIMPGGDMVDLVGSVELLAHEPIQTARLYTSKDRALRLDTFLLGKQPLCELKSRPFMDALQQMPAMDLGRTGTTDEFSDFLAAASEDYVQKFEPGRAIRHFHMCKCVEGTERVHVELDNEALAGFDRVMVAMANPPAKGLLLQALKVFAREGVNVQRAYGDVFDRGEAGTIAVMSFYVDHESSWEKLECEQYCRIRRQLKAIKWFAFHGLERLAGEDGWELSQVMLMQAACEFAHQFLIRKNIYAYTSGKIVHTALKNRDILLKLRTYFEARFDPAVRKGRDALIAQAKDAVHQALRDVSDDIPRKILGYIFRFFRYVLRTNYYMPERFGLSFRMDSAVLPAVPGEETPYGFYCFHGPNCFAFQVRYRDMARGGVRVVPTRTQEQFEIESNRLYDEANKLARAQQYKNKDIPEGGSKAVILLGPEAEIDLAVKATIDSLLDLIVTDSDGNLPDEVVDYLGREEIIYLGPDEHITPEHIMWIAQRAEMRGYKWPSTFMSSKPRAGINHKQYGVTSEGVVVYAHEVLKVLGIDPEKEPFTVKLTGGPAGDVASNVILIMRREYGDNARFVSMSDGHGAAYDPDGLDHGELVQLIEAGGRAHQFNPDLLTGRGAFVAATDTPEGVKLRDDLHNTAVADIFIPAGGRPDTMNMKNWQRFLQADGTPSARAMVEGANIFISPEARAKLEQKGVLCVPGPSANKTGVICSSYEILAGLILSEEEFIEIKDQYVEQLLVILRARARSEARTLLREHRFSGGEKSLTDLSYELSRAINGLGDAIGVELEEQVADQGLSGALRDLILAYCPEVLSTRYPDRVLERVPRPHQIALLSKYVASKILYNEGLGWMDRLIRARDLGDVIRVYLDKEKEVGRLLAAVADSDLENKDEISRIIRTSGRKQLTLHELGLD